MIRKAQYAGSWYPADPAELRAQISAYTPVSSSPEKVLGVVAPHAGVVYSGHVAGALYGRVEIPDTVVVLSVNHRGVGARAALSSSGTWETPLGRVPVQEGAAAELKKQIPLLEEDALAHAREHSLELHLPFLQVRNPGFRLVPVCLQHLGFSDCRRMGKGLAAMVRASPDAKLLVASSDMSHFETEASARDKDALAIRRILALDPEGLYETVRRERITMCGVIPVTVLLCACLELGARGAELVKYATSGDVSGDLASVVGYAGILVR